MRAEGLEGETSRQGFLGDDFTLNRIWGEPLGHYVFVISSPCTLLADGVHGEQRSTSRWLGS